MAVIRRGVSEQGHNAENSVPFPINICNRGFSPSGYFFEMSDKTSFSMTSFVRGDAGFFREAGTPFTEALNGIQDLGLDLPDAARLNRAIRNDVYDGGMLGLVIMAGTVAATVGTRIAGKVIDEVYEIVIKPRIVPLFKKIDAKLSKNPSPKCLNVSIWYEHLNVLVSVTLKGDSFEAIEKDLNVLRATHLSALNWIGQHGVQSPVHHYDIRAGRVTATPVLGDTISNLI